MKLKKINKYFKKNQIYKKREFSTALNVDVLLCNFKRFVSKLRIVCYITKKNLKLFEHKIIEL